MQLESLKTFCDLAETKSFTTAAKINEVTQSAVSQQVSAMERQFESLLIQRSKKMFRLTREGEVVYDYSKQISKTYDELHTKLTALKDVISGTIHVAVIYTFGLHDLPPYLNKYLQRHPEVNVHVEYLPTKQIYEDVLSNVIDLGLVAYPSNHPRLKIVPLRKDKLVLICAPEHRFAKSKGVKLRELAGLPFISFGPMVPMRKAVDRLLREHHAPVHRAMEFDNIEILKRAVEIDAGLSIVPETTVTQEIETQTLARVEIRDGDFYRTLAVIHKADKTLTPAMKEFLEVLKGS